MNKEQKTVTIVGPTVKNPDGSVKFTQGPREIPARVWEHPQSRVDLINGGMRLASDINEPSFDAPVKRGPGRPSTTQKQLIALQAEIEKIKAENEALKVKNNVTNDPPDADQA